MGQAMAHQMRPAVRARLGTLACMTLVVREPRGPFRPRLLLDARVVNVPMAYNPTFVLLSSLQPFFFKSIQPNEETSPSAVMYDSSDKYPSSFFYNIFVGVCATICVTKVSSIHPFLGLYRRTPCVQSHA